MNYMDIPGHTFEEECRIIQRIVKTLPVDPMIVEIGTGAGRVTAAILQSLEQSKKDGYIYSIDDYSQPEKYNHPEWSAYYAKTHISNYGYNFKLIHEDSATISKEFTDSKLDMVYIDGGHTYIQVSEDIKAWLPKIKKGGIMAGHDWQPRSSDGRNVIRAISELLFTDPNIKFHVERQVWWMIK